jgi:hypothetical protein
MMVTAVSKFSSDRERRLWFWTLTVIVAIYSTLGLARTLAEELGNRDLFGAVFFGAFIILIPVAIVALGLNVRPGGLEIGVAVGILAAYAMVFSRIAMPAERGHLFEYGVVALLIHEALTERVSQGRRIPVPALTAIGATILVGAIDEFIQLLLPSRVFDPADIFIDSVSALMAVVAKVGVDVARRRRPTPPTGSHRRAGRGHEDENGGPSTCNPIGTTVARNELNEEDQRGSANP